MNDSIYYQLSSHSSFPLPGAEAVVCLLSAASTPDEAGEELASEDAVGPFRKAAVPTTSER
jgi:hypothetical protein